ncbi:MAG: MerR family transcriptional regulator, partial [Deltaproteobacteria bacterium]|nr:MerR family transcriptional regulator [Deltaproteobacteria bacterium]
METTNQELDYKSATMSISELSQMSGFNKSTIQHYLKLGLLPNPTKVRPNLCVYTDTHLKV